MAGRCAEVRGQEPAEPVRRTPRRVSGHRRREPAGPPRRRCRDPPPSDENIPGARREVVPETETFHKTH